MVIEENLIQGSDLILELEDIIDSQFLVKLIRKSNDFGEDFLECAISAMAILNEIFYHELEN